MKRKILKKIAVALVCLMLVSAIGVFSVNAYVKSVGEEKIITPEQASALNDIDCIIVLGCFVESDGTPCDMLRDRLDRGIELYKSGAAPKIIMSGDHGTVEYDEVNAMKQYAIDNGVPSCDIFMDHAGFSTYESVYRAKEVFAADKIIIVTQEYHLTRALYIADKLGVEAYGVASDYHTYSGQTSRDIREVLARNKDFATSIFKPEPTYLGEVIPVSGNGDSTND